MLDYVNHLMVDDFVNTTLELINNFKLGIIEYPKTTLTLPQLKRLL